MTGSDLTGATYTLKGHFAPGQTATVLGRDGLFPGTDRWLVETSQGRRWGCSGDSIRATRAEASPPPDCKLRQGISSIECSCSHCLALHAANEAKAHAPEPRIYICAGNHPGCLFSATEPTCPVAGCHAAVEYCGRDTAANRAAMQQPGPLAWIGEDPPCPSRSPTLPGSRSDATLTSAPTVSITTTAAASTAPSSPATAASTASAEAPVSCQRCLDSYLTPDGGDCTCRPCDQCGALRAIDCTCAAAQLAARGLPCSRCNHAAAAHTPGCAVRIHDADALAPYQRCPCAYYVQWPAEDAARAALHQQQAAAILAARDRPPIAGGSDEVPAELFDLNSGHRCDGCGRLVSHAARPGQRCICNPPTEPSPVARISALCSAPKRRTRRQIADGQAALLAECQPGAMVAFDGTVYVQPEFC